jgi:uncharacterized Zn finger protein (UPF0148 family)
MSLAEAAPVPSHCPRCRGPLFQGYEDEYGCLMCGERIFPQPSVRSEPRPVVQERPRKRGRPRKQPWSRKGPSLSAG